MTVARFIGRIPELAALQEVTSGSRITAVYGRRRIGKTRLVQEAFAGELVFDFEGLEGASSASQREHFAATLYQHTKREEHRVAATADWRDLLILLFEHIGPEPTVLFFDEFQWMTAGRQELVSKLKLIWDRYSVKRNIHLVLCGSVSSFLVRKVIRARALYGRVDRIIDLGPLTFPEVRKGFFSHRSVREALEAYLTVGGVPKYLELFNSHKSTRLNLVDLGFSSGAYFLDELDRLFVSHFGTIPHYKKIVRFLCHRGFATRKQIAQHLNRHSGGQLSDLLEDLCLAGLVETYGPVHNPDSTYLRRYRIADPFIRFHDRFIRPSRAKIRRTAEGLPLHRALPDAKFDQYLGLAFEHFCDRHANLIARKLGFGDVDYDHGAWYRRGDLETGAQIDLLFKRADKVLTLCEVKFREKVGSKIISEVERKVAALSSEIPSYSVEKVLISALPPTDEVVATGYFSKILTADDLTDH